MRVNVDSDIEGDHRFKLLGAKLGMRWDLAVGLLTSRVWMHAYRRRVVELDPSLVDAVAEWPGLAEAMIFAALAVPQANGLIRICGVQVRLDWLLLQDAKREQANEEKRRRAGLPPRDATDDGGGLVNVMGNTVDGAARHPSALAPAHDLFGAVVAPASAPSGPRERSRSAVKKGGADSVVTARDAFHAAYLGKYETKPTWGAKQIAILKRLVTAHGADEVVRRIGILFTSPPQWLAESSVDVNTLANHFDKLAVAVVPRAGYQPQQRGSQIARGAETLADLREKERKS